MNTLCVTFYTCAGHLQAVLSSEQISFLFLIQGRHLVRSGASTINPHPFSAPPPPKLVKSLVRVLSALMLYAPVEKYSLFFILSMYGKTHLWYKHGSRMYPRLITSSCQLASALSNWAHVDPVAASRLQCFRTLLCLQTL